MARYILMRLVGLIPVLLILSMITFALMHEVPGGPWKEGQRPFSEAAARCFEGALRAGQAGLAAIPDVDLRRRPAGLRHVVQASRRDGHRPHRPHLADDHAPRADGADRGVRRRPAAGHHRRAQAEHLAGLSRHAVFDPGLRDAALCLGHPVHPDLCAGAEVGADGRLGFAQAVDPAGAGLLAGADRHDRALHSRQRHRGDARRLCAHGARQRPQRAERSCCAMCCGMR